MAELWLFNWFQNGGRRHIGFLHYVNFGIKSDCGTLFPTYVSNSAQMRAKMAELLPKMWFSIWRPPPFSILSNMSSEGKSCPGTIFSLSVTNKTFHTFLQRRPQRYRKRWCHFHRPASQDPQQPDHQFKTTITSKWPLGAADGEVRSDHFTRVSRTRRILH